MTLFAFLTRVGSFKGLQRFFWHMDRTCIDKLWLKNICDLGVGLLEERTVGSNKCERARQILVLLISQSDKWDNATDFAIRFVAFIYK